MNTAVLSILTLSVFLVCGQALGSPPASLETLMTTIAKGEGREVYEAFQVIPNAADTTEKKMTAFEGLSVYLGQPPRYFVVRDWFSPRHHVRARQFSYGEFAASTIIALGEPGRRGLVELLTDRSESVAEHAALTLCQIEATAIHAKNQPETKRSPPLDADQRKALEAFLQQRGNSLSIHTLTYFYDAGHTSAATYMHNILIATPDHSEKHRAAIYLGSYGYEPALDDFLRIFKTTSDDGLRGTIAGKFQNFSDSERVIAAIEEIRANTEDEGLLKACHRALEEVRYRAEVRKARSKDGS
jgi:hypothetical protein